MKWAFSDESARSNQFVMVAAVVDTDEVRRSRAALRRLLRPGQRQLHLVKESRNRRDAILVEIGALPVELLVARISLVGSTVRAARAAVVVRLTDALVERSVVTWTLDAIDREEVRRDREAIALRIAVLDAGDRLTYEHRDAHAEPMIWVADAAAWLASGGRAGVSLEFIEVP